MVMWRDSCVAVLTSPRERTGERFGTNNTSSKVSPRSGRIFMVVILSSRLKWRVGYYTTDYTTSHPRRK
jgi:hypothetical protein